MKIKSLFWLTVSLFMLISVANAAQSFNVSVSSITENIVTSTSSSSTFTITNTGDESINLTLNDTNLVSGSDSINPVLNDTSVTNLPAGSAVDILYSYTSTAATGIFTGSITVENADNASQTETIGVSITVNSSATGAEVTFIDSGDDEIDELNFETEENDDDSVRFFIENTGDEDLTNIVLSIDEDESEFDDSDFTIFINGDEEDEISSLSAGETTDEIEIVFDAPSGIDVGTYNDVQLLVEADGGLSAQLDIEVRIFGEDEQIEILQSSLDVRSGLLSMIGEAGERVDDYEFEIENTGDVDVNDITFELDGDLEEEFTVNSIPQEAVTFRPSSVDLDENDDDQIEVIVEIPEGQASGNYFATIRAVSSTGNVYDDIRLELRVIGDVYIQEINYDETVAPGDRVEVEVVVKNQGSQTYRNVKVTGSLFDVDVGNSDIHETSPSFILNVNDEKTQTLIFDLPEDAKHGSPTLEIRVTYDGEEVIEVEELEVVRPAHNLVVKSSAINPPVIRCEGTLYSYMRVQNLGRFDENIKITTTIVGTDITAQTNTFELDTDEEIQKNHVLSVNGLEPGMYTVENRVTYSGNLFLKREHDLRIGECIDDSVIVEPINETPENETGNGLFTGVENSTVYLGAALGAVIILIIISLFFL